VAYGAPPLHPLGSELLRTVGTAARTFLVPVDYGAPCTLWPQAANEFSDRLVYDSSYILWAQAKMTSDGSKDWTYLNFSWRRLGSLPHVAGSRHLHFNFTSQLGALERKRISFAVFAGALNRAFCTRQDRPHCEVELILPHGVDV